MVSGVNGSVGIDISALDAARRTQPGQAPELQAPSFEALDADQDGALTVEELSGGRLSEFPALAETLFGAIDADGGGSISQQEFSAFGERIAENLSALKDKILSGVGGGLGFGGLNRGGDLLSLLEGDASEKDGAERRGDTSALLDQLLADLDTDGGGALPETEKSALLDELRAAAAEQRQHWTQQALSAYEQGRAALAA